MQRTTLAHGWKLKQLTPASQLDGRLLGEISRAAWDEGWLEVGRMPAMVHPVLLAHGLIEAPWLPGRAAACRWVAEQDWVYAVQFEAADPGGQQWIRFEGLDTIVDVYLNGERVARHSSAFTPLRVDVTGRLRAQNTLALHVRTVFDLSGGQPQPIRLVDGDPLRPVRRPGNNYDTYLGPYPYFSRVGVFDEVILESAGAAEMSHLLVDGSLSEDLQVGTVQVQVEGTSRTADLCLRVRLLSPEGRAVELAEVPLAVSGDAYQGQASIHARAPLLWWPRGYGGQPLYRVEVTLVAGGQPVQQELRTLGFRRIDMPEPLHFQVNGVPVRLWGGNWVSPDWISAAWDAERAERLFDLAEHAHFNAFRVWGVVESPRDPFYELADRRGFLLWQDFAGLPLRPDEASRATCRAEAAATIERLKHHPSILMWCGGNEAAMWNESEFGGPGGEWPGRAAAEQDVGQICQQMDPARPYLPNSPYHGLDANDPQRWDTHGYTNIWYIPGYDYLVFASEDTRIAAPPLHSLERFVAPEDLWPADYSPAYTHGCEHPWPESWMRYTTSQSWKKTGPVEQFYDATNPAELVYRLGMAEALYYRDTVERQRRGRPAGDRSDRRACGGYLVWKFNDSWPQIYSGKVDYFLEPYIPYYALRCAYAPLLVSIEVGTYVWLWVVNDTPEPVAGEVVFQLFHLRDNAIKQEIVRPVRIAPDHSVEVMRLDQAGLGTFHRDHVLYARLRDTEGQVLARATALADIERRITFPAARLEVRVQDGALAITADRFARSVVLEGDAGGDPFGWFFEDNWFDLMPGETRIVRVLGRHERGRVTARAWYSPHATTVAWQR